MFLVSRFVGNHVSCTTERFHRAFCELVTGNGQGKLLDPRKKSVERIIHFGDSCQVDDAYIIVALCMLCIIQST